jgi:predicted DNA-binding transcriptional regulator AlpA
MDNKNLDLLTRADIKRLGIALSNTQLLRLERNNRFPRRIYLTPARVVWYAREIFAWIEARAAEREHRVYANY